MKYLISGLLIQFIFIVSWANAENRAEYKDVFRISSRPPIPISQRGTSTSGATQNRNLTVAKPAGAITGDILIVNIVYLRNNATATNPVLAGWDLVNAAWLTDTDKETIRGAVLYKVLTAADDAVASYTFDLGTNTANAVGGIMAFSGVDPVNPFDAALGSLRVSQGIKSNTVSAQSITTSTADAAVLMLSQANDNMNWKDTIGTSGCWQINGPAYLSELLDVPYKVNSANLSIGAAWALKAMPGNTGAGTVSFVDPLAVRDFGAILLALRPLESIAAAPSITSALVLSNTYGMGNSYQISASNYPTSFAVSGLASGITINSSTGALTFDSHIPVGEYSITVSAYNAEGTGNATLVYTVNAYPITVTANNVVKCKGVNLDLGSTAFSINTSMPNGELIDAVVLSSIGSVGVSESGSYPIVPSAASGSSGFLESNYAILYVAGNLTVKPFNAWTGAVNGSWNQAGNWCLSGTAVPESTSAVEIWPEGATLEIDAAVSAGSLMIKPGASVVMRTGGSLQLYGFWNNQGSFQAETGTAVILNSGDYTIGGSQPTVFRNLTLSGGGNKTITGSISISGLLTMNNGYVVSTATLPLIINNGGSVVGASNASFVKGYVKKIGTNGLANFSFDFPIGQVDDLIYDPLRITFPVSSATDAFIVGHQHAAYPSTAKRLYVKNIAVEYWDVIKSSLIHNINGVSIRMHYHVTSNSGGDASGYFPGASILTNYKVGHYNTESAQWEIAVSGAATLNRVEVGGDLISGYLVVDHVKQFSPFAPIELEASALPVTISSFQVQLSDAGKVQLEWVTAQEQMNKGFWVERKLVNQGKFERIGFVPSQADGGSSFKSIGYQYSDIPGLSGSVLYRLVQEDLDGKSTASEIKKVELAALNVVEVYPNPSKGRVFVSMLDKKNDYSLTVIGGNGSIVSQIKLLSDLGVCIDLPHAGFYLFCLRNLKTGMVTIYRHIVQH